MIFLPNKIYFYYESLFLEYSKDKKNFYLNFNSSFDLNVYNNFLEIHKIYLNEKKATNVGYPLNLNTKTLLDYISLLKNIKKEIGFYLRWINDIEKYYGRCLSNKPNNTLQKEDLKYYLNEYKILGFPFFNEIIEDVEKEIITDKTYSAISNMYMDFTSAEFRIEFETYFLNLLNFNIKQELSYIDFPFGLQIIDQHKMDFDEQIFKNQFGWILFSRLISVYGKYNSSFSFFVSSDENRKID